MIFPRAAKVFFMIPSLRQGHGYGKDKEIIDPTTKVLSLKYFVATIRYLKTPKSLNFMHA